MSAIKSEQYNPDISEITARIVGNNDSIIYHALRANLAAFHSYHALEQIESAEVEAMYICAGVGTAQKFSEFVGDSDKAVGMLQEGYKEITEFLGKK